MTALEERGHFWWDDEAVSQAEDPTTTITGLLRISDEGVIDLELDATLPSGQHPFAAFVGRKPAGKFIRGILKGSSTYVLLSDLQKNGGEVRSHGVSYENYRAARCLVGDRDMTRAAQLSRFKRLEISLKGFDRWLWLNSIDITRNETELTAKYLKPDDLTFAIEGGRLSVHYDVTGPWGPQKTGTARLEESASLIFTSDDHFQFERLRDLHGYVSDLLLLLTGSNFNVDWPTISTTEQGQGSCTLYFQRAKCDPGSPKVHECWVLFPKVRHLFGELFANWSAKREEYRLGFALYLATRRGLPLYIEHRFMSLVWGIESFHRRKFPDTSTSAKLVKKIERILRDLKLAKDRKWLANRLKDAHEPPLESRIVQVFSDLDIGLDEDFLMQFATECAARRNDISHFGGQRGQGDYQEFMLDLRNKSEALSYLYHALLLKEIGLDEAVLRNAIDNGGLSFRIRTALEQARLRKPLPEPPISVSGP